jgi:mannose-6-phosphate isomerase-like protein (cupin superfamily)
MGNADPQTTLRDRDAGENEVFRLHFEWTGETRTSLHKHRGWELVLVLTGTIGAVVDGKRTAAGPGEYIHLPAVTAHAIWAEEPASFEVIGVRGLGLTMIVPTASGERSEVPIYSREGRWAQDPPPGLSYTSGQEADRLRRLSLTLLNSDRADTLRSEP